MTDIKKDHVLPAGGGAVTGGAAGAALGAVVGGPLGLVVGAVAGGAAGALLGDKVAHAADKGDGLGHFEQIHAGMPYFVDGMAWGDYAPAYALGLDAWRQDRGAQAFEPAEAALAARWDAARGGSRLTWAQARPAVEHAWREASRAATAGPPA